MRIFCLLLPVALAGVLAWAFLCHAQASPAHSLHILDLHSSGQEVAQLSLLPGSAVPGTGA